MAVYTQLNKQSIKAILSNYGIRINKFRPIAGGNSNTNYFLKGKKKEYILTIWEERSYSATKKLALLHQHLSKHNIPVPKIYSTLKGKPLLKYKGKPVLLKKWIKGTVVEDLSKKQLQQLGKSMAQLHQISDDNLVPKKHSYAKEAFPFAFDKNIDPKYEQWLQKRYHVITKHIPKDLKKGLIHGDLFYDNSLFKGKRLKAIIDFEESCYYYLIFDVGMGILGLCRTNGTIDLERAKYFIQGYQKIRRLPKVEKDLLQLFVEYSAMAVSYWRFWRYNIYTPIPALKNKHREMMQLAKAAKNIKKKDFKKVFELS